MFGRGKTSCISKQRQEVMKKYGTVLTEEQAGKYAAARAVCDDMISRGSILQDNFTGGGNIARRNGRW